MDDPVHTPTYPAPMHPPGAPTRNSKTQVPEPLSWRTGIFPRLRPGASVETVPAWSRRTRQLAIVAVCLVSLVGCCALAWWQWERFSSANGTFQNLGYVLQWPLFGLFPAFMFWRIKQLGTAAQVAESAAEKQEINPAPSRNQVIPPSRPSWESDSVAPDDELAAYNRYLAQLNESVDSKDARSNGRTHT